MPIRVPVNLASEPFRRNRSMLVASAALAIALFVVLLFQLSVIFQQRQQSAQIRVSLDALQRQTNALSVRQSKMDATLSEPANAVVLERSLFLNGLIQRKAISWSRIFADIETVMPPDVKLVSVRLPQITSGNQVLLDMVVGAKDYRPVIELLKHLETAQQFGPAAVVNSLPPSNTDPLWKYRVSVSYAQKL